ncbi:MAG: MYG1 family protein, partial [Spirochaetaceae bacterium]|nr:MYG1 family protein [Spirochaetaceae bacterium]
MPYNVITHSGKAHIDEILAIAVLAVHQGEQPEKIRRLPSDDVAEMVRAGDMTADTWVVDCGLMLDSNRRLFDHHQDGGLPSSALLMFRHLFPELEGSDLSDYFELVSKVDTGGLRSLEDIDSVGESRDYWSFPQQVLVRVFEKDPAGVVNLVSVGLADKIAFEEEKTAAAEWVAVPGRLVDVEIGGLTALEYTEHPPESLVNGLKGIDREVIREHQAAVIYGY